MGAELSAGEVQSGEEGGGLDAGVGLDEDVVGDEGGLQDAAAFGTADFVAILDDEERVFEGGADEAFDEDARSVLGVGDFAGAEEFGGGVGIGDFEAGGEIGSDFEGREAVVGGFRESETGTESVDGTGGGVWTGGREDLGEVVARDAADLEGEGVG